MRYIELNPVRANMVVRLSEYRWSSTRTNGLGKESYLISAHPLYLALGKMEEERCHAYRELFRHKIDGKLIHDIRDSVNQDLVLGREGFKDKIEIMLQRKVRKGTSGRPCVKEDEGIYYVY